MMKSNQSELTWDLLVVLNYYSPYVSGLTNVARDLAEGLVSKGWRVAVVTSQHDSNLPKEETLNGVCVFRTPVMTKVGKGVISPSFIPEVIKMSKFAAVTNIHAPMLEAGVIAKYCKSPVVMTYQCDVSLPPTLLGSVQNKFLDISTKVAARASKFVTVTSDDYADHSRVSASLKPRRVVVPATCHIRDAGEPLYRDGDGFHVGFLGRIVEEKGIEYLVDGFRALENEDARLLIAGDFGEIAGGSVISKVREHIGSDPRIQLLGFLPDESLNDFYSSLDAFALPSVNPFEAFGIVQVEAMMRGIPVIASDLPGVRQPVLETGMGTIVAPGCSTSVTLALKQLMKSPPDVALGTERARELYAFEKTLDKFESVFNEAAGRKETVKEEAEQSV